MAIHHSQVKKAEKMGCTIEEIEEHVRIFWPKRALSLYGVSGSDALAQMQAAQVLVDQGYAVKPTTEHPRLVNVYSGDLMLAQCPTTPVSAHKELVLSDNATWAEPANENEVTEEDADSIASAVLTPDVMPDENSINSIERSEKGVALDGAIAYREGTPAGDNPFATDEDQEEYDRASAWDEAWDAAADAAQEEEKDKGGSVVSAKYRTKYAEEGHPTHCGDWLAITLNNICGGKAQTDLDLFETICKMNNVDTSKYRREGVGWQGRIRMTGRNLMAKQIFLQGGVLNVPPAFGENGVFRAPADWMSAQRFKMPKATA